MNDRRGAAALASVAEGGLALARQPFMMHAHTSRLDRLWLGVFHTLTLPLQAWGHLTRFRAGPADARVSIACVGFERRFRLLLDALFGSVERVGQEERSAAWRADRLSQIDSDVIFVDVHPRFVSRFRTAGWLIVPEDVSWTGNLAELPPSRPSKSLKSDISKIERIGYELEAAGTDEDWDEFFDRMLVPHATRRFGDEARLPSRRPASSRTRAAVMRREAAWSALPSVVSSSGRAALVDRSP